MDKLYKKRLFTLTVCLVRTPVGHSLTFIISLLELIPQYHLEKFPEPLPNLVLIKICFPNEVDDVISSQDGQAKGGVKLIFIILVIGGLLTNRKCVLADYL